LLAIVKLSCAFATSPESHEHAAIAESLGYECAYFYDSPALYPDVWVQLCRAAERTERIALGPAVLVPSNRHPMTNAAAIAQLVGLAGEERVIVAVGSGFTGRMAMGQRALRWSFVAEYVRTLQALLRGDVVSWENAPIQMLHSPGMAPERPITVRWLIGAEGPKGLAVAQELGDGVFTAVASPPPRFDWIVSLTFGTVLEEGESADSERALAAAGHAGAVMLHGAYELSLLPEEELREWLTAYETVAADRRHLAMHYGHLLHLNPHDEPHVTGDLLTQFGLALTAEGWEKRFTELQDGGVTEMAFQPAGPDIPRELESFAEVFSRSMS
jgi:5,10-methylenetetrahydromethanopterin reductase